VKVGIDGRLLFRNVTGIERHMWNLCSGLNAQNHEGCSYLLYTTNAFEFAGDLQPGFREEVIASGPDLLRRRLQELESVDIYHLTWAGYNVMDSLLLLMMPRSIYTIHDLVQYKNPHYFPSESSARRYKRMRRLSAHWCDKVITISDYSKKDIVETLQIPPKKVEVIYLASDPRFKPIHDFQLLDAARRKFQIKGKLIFNLSTDYSHKNAKKLIHAFSELSKIERQPLQLIIAGQRYDKEGSKEIREMLSDIPYRENIQWLTHLPDDDVVLLYNLADVFVFPSLHEGFGLPVLEAMACGTPVVASTATSIPEVAGDAALSVDARDADEIVKGMKEILDNGSLRRTFIEKGFKQVARFSWERTAEQTQKVYEGLYHDVPPRKIEKAPEKFKFWLSCHLAVVAGMEDEISRLTDTISHIDARLDKLRASIPGRAYRRLKRAFGQKSATSAL